MTFKYIFSRILKSLGYRLSKDTKDNFDSCNILLPFVQNLHNTLGEDFNFIQVGANLGFQGGGGLNDPLRDFIDLNKEVRGILIEPMVEYLDIVKNIYKDNLNLNFENIALGASNSQLKLVRFKPGDYERNFYHGLATMKSNRIADLRNRAKKDNTEQYLQELIVPVFTPEYLKSKYNLSNVSLLQVDTEGFDYIIVKSFIDAGVYPKLINFEYTELSSEELDSCVTLLMMKEYKLIKHGADILAVSKDSMLISIYE